MAIWNISRAARCYLQRRPMSFQSAIAGLPAPVKDLVLKATKDGSDATLLGETEADQKTVNEWVEKSSKGDLWAAEGLKVCLATTLGVQN